MLNNMGLSGILTSWVLHYFVSCGALRPLYLNTTYNEGMDVELNCTGPQSSDVLDYITWKVKDVTIFFCLGRNCSKTNQRHILNVGVNYSSILQIANISLQDENTYKCEISTVWYLRVCYFTLVVQVRPDRLIILDNETNAIISKSFHINDGIPSAIRCQTNTSVKPTVNLEWILPEGLEIVEETDNEVTDEHDRRLVVPSTTLSFIPTNDDNGKIITCVAETYSATEPLQTSVYLKSEDQALEVTSFDDKLESWKSSEAATISETVTNIISEEGPDKRWNSHLRIIAGTLSVTVLLVISLIICGISIYRRNAAKESTVLISPAGRELPPIPILPLSTADDIIQISLKPISTRSRESRKNVKQSAKGGQNLQQPDGSSESTGYMDMKPITSPIASFLEEIDVQRCHSSEDQACYMNATLMPQIDDDNEDTCEHKNKNTARQWGKITRDPYYTNTGWCDDILDSTYI